MIYLYILMLTIVDVSLTVFGTINGYIEEANPFWAKMFDSNPIQAGIITFLIPALIILLLFLTKKMAKWFVYIPYGFVIIKTVVVFLHLSWMNTIF